MQNRGGRVADAFLREGWTGVMFLESDLVKRWPFEQGECIEQPMGGTREGMATWQKKYELDRKRGVKSAQKPCDKLYFCRGERGVGKHAGTGGRDEEWAGNSPKYRGGGDRCAVGGG